MTHTALSNSAEPSRLKKRLATYLAATGGAAAVVEADAAIVGNNTVVPFGINEEVDIDFNMDGQVDFQIDHDRVDLNGNDIDYLQIDKNDVNGAANPIPIIDTATFPVNGTVGNDTAESAHVVPDGAPLGTYPAALDFGTVIGPASTFDFQEGTAFNFTSDTIRANRLIDEDVTQIDQDPGFGNNPNVQAPLGSPGFIGLGGEVKYLGLKMDLNDANAINYGWVGIRITNEADATGEVVGFAYETDAGVPIQAGVVPEPASALMAAFGGAALVGAGLSRRFRGKK